MYVYICMSIYAHIYIYTHINLLHHVGLFYHFAWPYFQPYLVKFVWNFTIILENV